MQLRSQVAIVTGGSGAIGKAISLKLSKEGATVIIVDLNKKGGERISKQIKEAGNKVCFFEVDVTDDNRVQNMVRGVKKTFGHIDILVNNTGIISAFPLFHLDVKEWDKVLRVNVTGAFICSKAVSREMVNQKHGKIINISALAGKIGRPYIPHYTASKFAIIGLTKSLAEELAPYSINVNAVCPGFIDTPMLRKQLSKEAIIRGIRDEELKKEILAKIPFKKLGTPESVANIISFLASKEAEYITGQAINVDGGIETH